jgi:hypothetical protein
MTRQNYQRSSLAGDKKIVGSVMQITTSASQAKTKNKANKNKRILIHKKVNKIQHIFFVIFNILNKTINRPKFLLVYWLCHASRKITPQQHVTCALNLYI